ncbi:MULTISPECIES: DNA-3-methyladenine glycosylase I [unclassified Enterococcus]|uniref:DNA-3-methyladenine glycosylase I n=1 Tax=unclassified Enterococcus TaxID=2608891 RepID=UPI001557E9CC|nr:MULTISPECIES: DNA-3-methyladenine glycosylase I [unclassified Enterococcus]MBS7577232.1 DNA-3-methyladenine glycosylase I [Enterococcus sp. MMGLQ5-2]MBS7584675.1 DNA-3-methyladenine glycosylase I [Enterococcus sp. MMGLQ5-1]NPD12530.1 DNA-3-methyladenine glycosylase I [Enterococcus sp. MMGLQ5-1]NPD37066.1 DNA-3-methyladenine glycosylase I [Enterococcus sp. MMGLQ5-2]
MKQIRCAWAMSSEKMQAYHDTVWGRKETDDTALFRKLSLDLMQAGLSWQTILNKFDAFDQAFDHFNLEAVSKYSASDVERLMQNRGIVRNRLKINAIINNAQIINKMQSKGESFYHYLAFQIPDGHIKNHWQNMIDVPAHTQLSDQISKQMKRDGFKFVGTTIIYSFLQATGFVNDHLVDCVCYQKV